LLLLLLLEQFILRAVICGTFVFQLGTGWRFKKRPGLDYFLQQVGPPMFEVVIYTHEQGFVCYLFWILISFFFQFAVVWSKLWCSV